ncbi:MAG: RNA polymerase sporulation sigma factor SigE [Syntrophomonadaceae bacterium]|nr:RNA polymerase sporulation sigma factor SigE [Syntrophomonadaceae bacterium]MDD3888819.1 RNA polymerase sporulation sigma factor SigE [Syntrophomonadaceae bacterium]MDD4548206.1 RNA polymerase sporulation sigma factor SigE [Syntrophomonadaceae bacterium]
MYFLQYYLKKKLPEYIHYIGSTEVLPAPLKEAEEYTLIRRLEQGDMAVKSTLIEHNLRLVVYIAKKFENTGINIEDLVSIGTIGLIKAVNTFDPKKNIKLATYASRCIENEILMYLRRNLKNRVEVSLDEPLNVDWDGNELLLSDVLGTESDMIYKKIEGEVEKTLLWQAMHKLNAREKTIIQLRFGLGENSERTQKEVADILGISQSYISRLEKRILKRLQREIKKIE